MKETLSVHLEKKKKKKTEEKEIVRQNCVSETERLSSR